MNSLALNDEQPCGAPTKLVSHNLPVSGLDCLMCAISAPCGAPTKPARQNFPVLTSTRRPLPGHPADPVVKRVVKRVVKYRTSISFL